MISGDKFLLHEALANLVQNAVDFSGKNEEIRITGRLEGRSVKIIIEDHGPGIPDYAIDKVFDKFYSLQRPETGKKSTGLGLNFVRQVASLHSGDILLENRESRGTRAILSLPV
jgi:two-component system, OmpR family, sensor histidine kinase CreC